ncbi:MAG: carboxylate-amine ligase [Pseudomonadota bacterium]
MAYTAPPFTLGIEEEYLLVDLETYDLAAAPEGLMEDCAGALDTQVSPEFLQCQIEIGTKVCADIATAREDLKRLRATVAQCAKAYGLAPIAASCHPFADWRRQVHTKKERYDVLYHDLAGVAERMLICGMHVHVGVEAKETRIDLMNQLVYFLPHLLALSTSSPYWQGQDTGLASYRLTIFDNLPRTGLPPNLSSWSAYERTTGVLEELGIIEDTSKIWWDLRPSSRFPTVETRICDVPSRIEDTLMLAAAIQCLSRMLWRLSRLNQRWRTYEPFLVGENRWRAQRYGIAEGLIDFGAREIVPFGALMDEMLDLIGEDAEALGCIAELERVHRIVAEGTSSHRQRAGYRAARDAGADHDGAMRAIVAALIDEFHDGL